ncbi:MAG TPA: 2Fe-2S iron-sulfur cluster-binding protein [Vicinamibacterales bacterium]|nr:2Fe-2S iron-sulfur cluster-binding protein [Vicinamibacterales bacterium]
MDTVTLTIDGRPITVEKGKTVLQAAIENGIDVPYYCYHPGIGIDGSCRVCIVKIEKMPKLQTSCSTVCTDGMIVSTDTPEVVQARAGVFEFLLVNHPLDCPVCDKGGECPLQDFSYNFGPAQSRTDFPRRVFDGEGVKGDVDFGPTLMLNRQRCILCTRCVRFMREVDGDAQINIIDRGYGSEIATFQEEGVHSLLSGNLMDVCPVGAITTRDYRFKSRPWDNPNAVDTICTRCEKGCNTTAWLKAKPEWAKGSRLIRFTPRFVADVNGYWMCDIGRFDYHWLESDDRLRKPMMKDGRGTLQPVAWHDVYRDLIDKLSVAGRANADGVRFLLSAHASHEELFLFRRLAEELVGNTDGVTVTWTSSEKPQPPGTKFVVPEVDAPNVSGVTAFGLGHDVGALRAAVEAGRVSALYVFDPGPSTLGDVSWILAARAKGTLPLLIVQGVLMTPVAAAADFVLPGASSSEKEASYTNGQGRVQAVSRALPLIGDSMEDWHILVNLAKGLGVALSYADGAAVRADIAARFAGHTAFAGISDLIFGQPMEGRDWLQTSNPSERWKWDFMYQDLPPVKGDVELTALPPAPVAVIPLKEVK